MTTDNGELNELVEDKGIELFKQFGLKLLNNRG